MLINTDPTKFESEIKAEMARQVNKDYAALQLTKAKVLQDWEFSPANVQRQMGRKMSVAEFEAKLAQLNIPNLLTEVNPQNPTKKALYQIRDGNRVYLMAYENSEMPEYSIFSVKQNKFWNGERQIDRKDLPTPLSYELRDVIDNDGVNLGQVNIPVYDPDAPLPGQAVIDEPWHEVLRGWRTILGRLVEDGLVDASRVIAVFGDAERESWAVRMGRRDNNLAF